MIIRKAGKQDVPSMARLEELCFTTPWSEAALRQDVAENPLSFYLVAELAGETDGSGAIVQSEPGTDGTGGIVGYAGVWKIAGEGHITNVAVHPACREKGIGSALVGQLVQLLELEGVSEQTLEVRAGNLAAIGLYEKHGFRLAGIRKEYYQDNGEDALIMWRRVE